MWAKNKGIIVFSSFLGFVLWTYAPAFQAGFVTDWLVWQGFYEAGTWADVPRSFGYNGLHPVLHFFNFSMYELFGTSPLPWFLLFCLCHAINGFLLYKLMLKLPSNPKNTLLFFLGTLLFLLSPYAIEPTVWKVCLHYQLSLGLCLGSLWFTCDFWEKKHLKSAFYSCLLCFTAFFCLEWSLAIPILNALLLLVFLPHFGLKNLVSPVLYIAVPMFLCVVVYFMLNNYILGDWVGHYGAETHLKMDIHYMASTMGKYLAKHLLLLRYWDYQTQLDIYSIFEKSAIQSIISWALPLLFLSYIFVQLKTYTFPTKNTAQASDRSRLLAFGFFGFFAALLPVANMFFYTLLLGENDRYSYFALAFFCLFLVGIFEKLPKIPALVLTAFFLVCNAFFQQKTIQAWKQNAIAYNRLMDSFSWENAENVLVLAIPDNLQGLYMYRDAGDESRLEEALDLLKNRKPKGKTYEALRFNLSHADEGLRIEQDSAGAPLKLLFNQYGNWYWQTKPELAEKKGVWYETVQQEWHTEIILLDSLPKNTILIYPDSSRWKQYQIK